MDIKGLRDLEEKHHSQIVELARTLSELPPSRYQANYRYPWEILGELSGRLLEALHWYKEDSFVEGGYYVQDFYASPKYTAGISGLFEAHFFTVFSTLRTLTETIPMLLPLYDKDSSWHPTEGIPPAIFHQYDDIAPNHSVIVVIHHKLQEIYQDFAKYLEDQWSGGWR